MRRASNAMTATRRGHLFGRSAAAVLTRLRERELADLMEGERSMTSDFAHQLTLDQIRDGERLDLVADDAECGRSRAARPSPRSTGSTPCRLSRDGDRVARDRATARRRCNSAASPPASRCPRHRRAVRRWSSARRRRQAARHEEIELGEGDCDTVFHDGGRSISAPPSPIRLRSALDPYPRSAGAEAALKEAGMMTEEQASPFAALAQLKDGDSDKP